MPTRQHHYRTCRDPDCPRQACQAYLDGYLDGYQDATAAAADK